MRRRSSLMAIIKFCRICAITLVFALPVYAGGGLGDDHGNKDQTVRVLTAQADTIIRTDLDARRNDNYGCSNFLLVGTGRGGSGQPYGAPDAIRTLIRFNIASLPSQPIRAILELTLDGFDSGSTGAVYKVDVYRITEPWNEGRGLESSLIPYGPPQCVSGDAPAPEYDGARWETQPSFDPKRIARVTITQPCVGPQCAPQRVYQWDVTNLVQKWYDNKFQNYGLMLRDETSDGTFKGVAFGAREGNMFRMLWTPYLTVDAPRLIVTLRSQDVQDLHCDESPSR
jgi:hypothetical protein